MRLRARRAAPLLAAVLLLLAALLVGLQTDPGATAAARFLADRFNPLPGTDITVEEASGSWLGSLRLTGVSVTRAGDRLILNMPGNVTFDFDRASIRPQFFAVLNSVSEVLKEFDKTVVEVTGHDDSVRRIVGQEPPTGVHVEVSVDQVRSVGSG